MSAKRDKEPVHSVDISIKRLSSQAPRIVRLRFPNYKNLEPDSVVEFDYPVTVLLGRNGTNKSSILHALAGAPRGLTVSDYWFETHLDAIPETNEQGLKQSITHSYVGASGKTVECIKARAPRGKLDPDYWEAVKHSALYGFRNSSGDRVSPIKLDVEYLDFRGLLPAFDRYLYFPDRRHLSQLDKSAKSRGDLRRKYRPQDYLRRRTKSLRQSLKDKGVSLSSVELDVLSYVLERKYSKGTMLEHSLFHGHEGVTILFETPHLSQGYSEAFAGSGESAAAMLIHRIENTNRGSLVLLDEPETSLHPRAQQRMLEYLLQRTAEKQLQLVIATHSRYFAEPLPQSAIRVVRENANGRFQVDGSISAAEALHEITTIPPGRTILVEDERARRIVELELKNQQALVNTRVLVRSGGTSRIYADIRAHANAQRADLSVVFDGDQKPTSEIPPSGKLPQGAAELTQLIRELTKGRDRAGPDLEFVDAAEARAYVEFLRKNVFYLPSSTPEELVWSNEVISQLGVDAIQAETLTQEADFKHRLELVAKAKVGFKVETVFDLMLNHFFEKQSSVRTQLSATIRQIRGVK